MLLCGSASVLSGRSASLATTCMIAYKDSALPLIGARSYNMTEHRAGPASSQNARLHERLCARCDKMLRVVVSKYTDHDGNASGTFTDYMSPETNLTRREIDLSAQNGCYICSVVMMAGVGEQHGALSHNAFRCSFNVYCSESFGFNMLHVWIERHRQTSALRGPVSFALTSLDASSNSGSPPAVHSFHHGTGGRPNLILAAFGSLVLRNTGTGCFAPADLA